MALVVGYHAVFKIVVSYKVGHLAKLILKALLTCHHSGARGIELLHNVIQFAGAVHSLIIRFPCLTHLISNAPHYHRGMISVAQHHVGNIPVGILVIERFVISRLPFVECLIENKQSECVTYSKKLRRGRIVRTTNGIASYTLEGLKATEPHLIWHCHAKTTCILMQAHSLEFHILAIEPESSIGIKTDVAESEWSRYLIAHPTLGILYGSDKGVHNRRIAAPQLGIVHF